MRCFLGIGIFGLTYIFVFQYVGGIRHYGLFWILLLVAVWMAWEHVSQRVFLRWALHGCLFYSCCTAAGTWKKELGFEFSEARAMAQFLQQEGLERFPIAAHPAAAASAVLPYLKVQQFWYPGLQEYGSHMKWDGKYLQSELLPALEVLEHLRERSPGDLKSPLLFLSNTELPAPHRFGYALYYATPGKPWARSDEVFYLYLPLDLIAALRASTL